MTSSLRLYHYWRSSCSWRVRWALNYKGIEAALVPVSLLDGESEAPSHRERSPLGFVPVLERLELSGPSRFLSDSTAIVQWLEECFPSGPKLFPEDLWLRARVRSLAAIISSDTQPLQNLTVLHRHSSDLEQQKKWAQEVIFEGLQAFERAAAPFAGDFSVGHQLSWADLCLLPQLYNAERFGVSLDSLPVIRRVRDHAVLLESYRSSHPSRYEPQSP